MMSPDDRNRCVIIGGADIGEYDRIRSYLREDDYVIYCDCGLRHMNGLGAEPSLIVGDFDSYSDPHMETETITLPVEKDDTDTVYAAREGIRRGFQNFLLIGVTGDRMDHTLVNLYLLSFLDNNNCHGMIIDDYSEMELITGHGDSGQRGTAEVSCNYPYFSLVAIEGTAGGVTVRNAKFPLEDGQITPDYQYATSNEVLPGKTANISVSDGKLLLIKVL